MRAWCATDHGAERPVDSSRCAQGSTPLASQRKDARTIFARLINACWYVFKFGIAAVLIGGVAMCAYMYVRMDDEIRQQVESMLAQRYPHLSVSVGGARLVEGKGIAVYDVALADPSAPPGGDQLLAIDELMLFCPTKLTTLVQGPPDVQRVEIKFPRLAVRRDRTGRWNVAALVPQRPAGMKVPQIVIRNGAVSLQDAAGEVTQPLELRDIHANITPTLGNGSDGAMGLKIEAALGGNQAKRIELHASAAAPAWAGSGWIEVEQFHIDETLMAWAHSALPPWLQSTRVGATLEGTIKFSWNDFHTPPALAARLTLTGGKVDDPRLPASLTELTGEIRVDGDRQAIQDLHGKCGAATVAASVNRTGWSLRAPIALAARADHVALDGTLYRSLVQARDAGLKIAGVLQEQWDHFAPAGEVDATLQASFDGATWKPTAGLTGRRLSFESDKFRYRLTDGAGTIRCLPAGGGQPRRVNIDIVGHSRSTPLRIVGQVIDPQPDAAGWVEIRGAGLEVEQAMLDAIPNAQCREVIGQLHPAGRFDFAWRLERAAVKAEPHTTLRLDLTDLRVNYEKFPYPLRGIRGTIEARDNVWTFRDLTSSGRRTVHGAGTLRPIPEGGVELALRFIGQQTPLDVELYDALAPMGGGAAAPGAPPTGVQGVWAVLNPRGQVDLVADVVYRTGQAKPTIAVVIEPRESTQIRPTFFPYLMERVTGSLSYMDGRIEMRNMRAHHNELTTITTNGSGHFTPEGSWEFQLQGLTADNVTAGLELNSALPAQLRKILERLKPTGNFTLHNGVLRFRKSASQIEPLQADWDLQLDCHQTDLQCGIDLKYIDGSVRLRGSSDGARSYTAGMLELESVTFQNIQFTNVRGPIWADESKCLLGRPATDEQHEPPRAVTGNVYDGTLGLNAWVTFDNLPLYRADASVVGADLRRLVVERFGAQRQFTGKVDAELHVGGRGYNLAALTGDGKVHIRDANLYELSLLASLLKMLRTGAANNTAFTQSDIEFRLEGTDILLDKIDFLGDVVNLYGQGRTDFDHNLNLVFSAVVGRHDYQLPIVKNFVRKTNEQIMQMYVNGTLSSPEVTTEAFPGVAQMFQQLGSDLKNPLETLQGGREPRRTATQPPEAIRQ